ncbi:glucose-6-phosphate dehydrogenase [Paenibacillus koleovorans]|uniref:glucose-6-phosphate dehydrogenase n=1 Tax=Paenibacillus koleovorans TaxID=121608 RepID=UPI000FD9518E|nr:glucose-6-phosphate dehydrogenase [Paenibacillus koleovorans]
MEPATIVLFGATGDLAKRKIYPALYNMFLDGKLPQPFSLFGLGRREWTDESFQANIEKSIKQFSRRAPVDPESIKSFISAFRYRVLDVGCEEDYRKLLEQVEKREMELGIPQNRLFYLSVGPELFETIALQILGSGLGTVKGWKRLVIEKPFGHDLDSARLLNQTLSQAFTEQEIYRIDHYLGKPIVQRLESLQQAHPVFHDLWMDRKIANVQITANESVGVEERAGYYDRAGAIKDMFQNHMLQLLMMTAVYIPKESTSGKGSSKKTKVMEALKPLQKETVRNHVVRGQYSEGSIKGNAVAGYKAEPGIAPESMNDTFIAARLQIDNDDWQGVPFYIRTGKRLKEKSTRIVVEFQDAMEPASQESLAPNLLVFELSPEETITLQLHSSKPGRSETFQPIELDLGTNPMNSPEAYENLIWDALRGDPTFFAHWNEVELSWLWVTPILEAFAENKVPLLPYEAGSYGPAEADALLEADGFHWWFDDKQHLTSDRKGRTSYAYHTND